MQDKVHWYHFTGWMCTALQYVPSEAQDISGGCDMRVLIGFWSIR